MMLTFYTFKDKKNEPNPLIKNPGDVDGQMFDIGDCENCKIIIMDYCEQVQIDQLVNCRVFIGACASSIFIRNCENCVFYTACRQLRLREVVNSTLYIYSMAEVHIEYSNALKFAPFNGGYPEQERHLSSANLDSSHNLWYDIFDHNDPGKERLNWCLLPESEYEEPWFPTGTPCELAIKHTKPNTVVRVDDNGESMQSFSVQQLVADAQALQMSTSQTNIPSKTQPQPPSVPPPAEVGGVIPQKNEPVGNEAAILATIAAYANFKTPEDLAKVFHIFKSNKIYHINFLFIILNTLVFNIL